MIGIIDYGMGNLRSVSQALDHVQTRWCFVRTPEEMKSCDKLLLPGVGAFEDAIAALHRQELTEPLLAALGEGRPFLGVCLGMQLLFEESLEHGRHKGLAVLPGRVVRFQFDPVKQADLKIPHMGWNQAVWNRDCPLLAGIPSGAWFYFVHSFYCVPADEDVVLARTDYGGEFVSMVWKDNVYACQFHPEKSQDMGLKMYRNFANL